MRWFRRQGRPTLNDLPIFTRGERWRVRLASRLFPDWYVRQLNGLRDNLHREYDRHSEQARAHEAKLKAAEMRVAAMRAELADLKGAVGIEAQRAICRQKVVYGTQEAAQYAALALYYMDRRTVKEYACPVCPHWHLTTSTRPSALVDAELIDKRYSRRATVKVGDAIPAGVADRLQAVARDGAAG